ncbi:MAG: plastocyanin/azurin family copper-binding protein [Nitrosopumilaceae archaeon]
MKNRDSSIFIFLLSISIVIVSSIPESFADHMTASVSITQGSSVPGCETTNSCYLPSVVTIDVGGEVIWSNDDTAAHTVTSGHLNVDPDNLGTVFDSSLFMAGNTFSHKFDAPGAYPYFCMVHPWMTGLVNVIPSTSSTPTLSIPPPPANTDVVITTGSSVPGCEVSNSCYSPWLISTKVGDTITWYNADSAAHTVTSGDLINNPDAIGSEFDSSLFMSGKTFSHTFTRAGTFDYFCMVHPWMTGQVIVSGDTPMPSISIYTSSRTYRGGDIIQIFGEVKNPVDTTPVSLRIISPNGNIVTIEQVDLDRSGKFSASISYTQGSLWNLSGTYTVDADHGLTAQNIATAITTFEFSAASGSRPSTTIGVEGTDFLLSYTITGGRVLSITPYVAVAIRHPPPSFLSTTHFPSFITVPSPQTDSDTGGGSLVAMAFVRIKEFNVV